jgi:hypothetical protein
MRCSLSNSLARYFFIIFKVPTGVYLLTVALSARSFEQKKYALEHRAHHENEIISKTPAAIRRETNCATSDELSTSQVHIK